MSFSSFPYRSPKKFKPTPTKSTSTLRSTHQSKEEWNTYLTDDDKFRLTNEEILRRKQQLISKHNILLNPSSIVTTPSSPSTTLSSFHKTSSSSIIKKSKLKKSKLNSNDKTKEEMMSKGKGKDKLLKEFTSLDLLNNYSELEITDDDYDDVHEEDNQEEEEELTESEYYTNELNSKRKEKKTTRKHFENKEKSSKPSISINKYSKKTVLHTQQSPQVAQKDLKDITTMIQALHQELKYYEELSGRRSFLDLNELNSVLDLSSNDTISYTTTMRYLVQLVCCPFSLFTNTIVGLSNYELFIKE